jgi:hypothetical protein
MLEQYINGETAFTQPGFWDFNAIINCTNDAIPTRWVTDDLDLNASGVEYLIFTPKDHNIKATFCYPVTKQPIPMTREVFVSIIDSVKAQAKGE